jgi:hypothetical protein
MRIKQHRTRSISRVPSSSFKMQNDEKRRQTNWCTRWLFSLQDTRMRRSTSATIQSVPDLDVTYPVDPARTIHFPAYVRFVQEDFSWFAMSPLSIVQDTTFSWQLCSTERPLWTRLCYWSVDPVYRLFRCDMYIHFPLSYKFAMVNCSWQRIVSATSNIGALGGYRNHETEAYRYLAKQDRLGERSASKGAIRADS